MLLTASFLLHQNEVRMKPSILLFSSICLLVCGCGGQPSPMDGEFEVLHDIGWVLRNSTSLMDKAILSNQDIMSQITRTNTRFVIVEPTTDSFKALLDSKNITGTQFLLSPHLDYFLKSHIVIGATDKDGEYTSMSGMKWNVTTNGINIPNSINGIKMLGYGFTIANYDTKAEKYTSPLVISPAPLTELK